MSGIFSTFGKALSSFGEALGMLFGSSYKNNYIKENQKYLEELDINQNIPQYPGGIDPAKSFDNYIQQLDKNLKNKDIK